MNKQENGISTGIVFKGKIQVTTDAPQALQDAINKATGDSNADAILYAYSNQLYVSWTEVRKAALDATANEEFKKAVFGTPKILRRKPSIAMIPRAPTTCGTYGIM